MQYHILISRINPSLKIDFVRVCTIENGQAKTLSTEDYDNLVAIPRFAQLNYFFDTSSISDSMYIAHEEISNLISYLLESTRCSFDFFDNNLVIVFDYDTEKETPKKK
jgi:hypothetical protein